MIDERKVITKLNKKKQKYRDEHTDTLIPFVIDEIIQMLEVEARNQQKQNKMKGVRQR